MNPKPRLTPGAKWGYGVAELGHGASEFFIQLYLLKFYADTVGLEPAIAGVVLAVAVVWDAITDPLMGSISDRTRWKSGKRRPWIAIGGVTLALSFVMLFAPPELADQSSKATYLLVSYLLVNTSMTLLAVPHYALGGDLAKDPESRNQLFGIRFLFANFGLLTGILVPGLVIKFAGGSLPVEASTLRTVWIIAGIIAITALITVWALKDLDPPAGEEQAGQFWRELIGGLGSVLRNRSFLPLLAAYIIGTVGRTINASVALFYYEYRLLLEENQVFLFVLMPFTLMIALSILAWLAIARRWGKKRTAIRGVFLLGLSTSIAYLVFPPGQLTGPIAAGFIGGFLVGAIFLLDAMVADTADVDLALKGKQREGLYFGFWRMGSKMARAIGLVISGNLLGLAGYEIGAESQSAGTAMGLAWIFGPGVGIFLMLAALILLRYPLDETKLRRIRKILSWRQSRSSSPNGS